MNKSGKPLEVKAAPYTPPGEKMIVVKNGAVAINPVDWIKQALGNLMFSYIKYPFILGSDLAGEVVEVGKGVTRFHVGDRIIGHAVGMDQRSNTSAEGAFQQYTVIRENLASPIPTSLSYEKACVLPLCLSTAACGLFMKDYLALQYPTVLPKPTGETLLVWGGSTSVGSNAIQLAVAAGYEVITTASPKNFGYVKMLGAVKAFDYRSKTVVVDIIEEFAKRKSAGAIAIGNGSIEPCIDIIGASKGRKFIATASVTMPGGVPSNFLELLSTGGCMAWGGATNLLKCKLKHVDTKFIFGSDLMVNEVSHLIYEDFLPTALAEDRYIAAPEPQVVGRGLEHIQEAMDINKRGVSAKKMVVSL
jgi:NADPH:quinone reductase-like Zn-dependent oxidoreductase